MNKRGFTLVEMLAVISFIGVLLIIIVPSILGLINQRTTEIEGIFTETVETATNLYIDKYGRDYRLIEGDIYCIPVQDLIKEDFLKDEILEQTDIYNIDDILEINVFQHRSFTMEVNHECEPFSAQNLYRDDSGASMPLLDDFLVPIVGTESGFIKADTTKRWYDYEIGQWANAVLVTEESYDSYQGGFTGEIAEEDILGYFVWIPRYRYQLFNYDGQSMSEETIEIRFESARSVITTGTENGDWHTHPAFNFGDQKLGGFWIGKYMTTGSFLEPTVLPNEVMQQNSNLVDNYQTVSNFADNLENLNARMTKNTEWGAVALLSKSEYGNADPVWVNPNSNYLTGCAGNSQLASSTTTCNQFDSVNGVNASTTGNKYGVYDMSGGAYESVMGAMYDEGNVSLQIAESDFSNLNTILSRYIDKYQYGETSTNSAAYNRRILGDATAETRNWDNSSQEFVYDENPFFLRGGNINNPGIFSFDPSPGNITSGFRIVLSKE